MKRGDETFLKIQAIADEYGVPDWVWYPIMLMESAGKPKAHNTKGEDSRGLFQINVGVHTQWKDLDLFDPEVNANIAIPNFIAPSWDKIKNDSSMTPEDMTAYVWRYGIRPKWDEAKEFNIKQATSSYLLNEPIWVPSNPTRVTLDDIGAATGDGLTNVVRYILGFDTTIEEAREETKKKYGTYQPEAKKFFEIVDGISGAIKNPEEKIVPHIVTIVLLVVGAVLLIMVLKSMFLDGGKQIVLAKEGGAA